LDWNSHDSHQRKSVSENAFLFPQAERAARPMPHWGIRNIYLIYLFKVVFARSRREFSLEKKETVVNKFDSLGLLQFSYETSSRRSAQGKEQNKMQDRWNKPEAGKRRSCKSFFLCYRNEPVTEVAYQMEEI
jgi:hypothetical protein